jgi:calcium binding protein 39
MNFNLFKPKQKTPPELVRNAKDAVHRLDTSDKRKVITVGSLYMLQHASARSCA